MTSQRRTIRILQFDWLIVNLSRSQTSIERKTKVADLNEVCDFYCKAFIFLSLTEERIKEGQKKKLKEMKGNTKTLIWTQPRPSSKNSMLPYSILDSGFAYYF